MIHVITIVATRCSNFRGYSTRVQTEVMTDRITSRQIQIQGSDRVRQGERNERNNDQDYVLGSDRDREFRTSHFFILAYLDARWAMICNVLVLIQTNMKDIFVGVA